MVILPTTNEIIKLYNLNPNKKLGQNFILDPNFNSRIVKAAGELSNYVVLEIGPGPGGLTRALLEANALKVVAVEYDFRCIEALKPLQEKYGHRLEIFNFDALNITETELVPKNSKIVANLPYNIATELLFKWLEQKTLFSSMTLMFQKEVAMRIQASPGSKLYGRLSVMSQFYCDVEYQFDVPPSLFFPQPKVTSGIINLVPKRQLPEIDAKLLSYICKVVFGQRRKVLSNSLKQLTNKPIELLQECNISASKRPEELSLEEFCTLTRAYQDFRNI
ncbi:Ribosomal RNA small subunit methyltransferase A [Rickettsiales bacterium Ac37b]|nr:Ribosomal RNA small subunit methyltransferase A [Rickettsiales bacterium Ac37b]